ncbi:MAG: hypothetical protein PVG79_08715 [Gemmatimonadales bacterium]|jgi:hypothetical protein
MSPKRPWLPLAFLVLITACSGEQLTVDLEQERAEILSLYEGNRSCLLDGDVDLCMSRYAVDVDEYVAVFEGEIAKLNRSELDGDWRAALETREYSEVNILAPPEIHLSADGSMAWGVIKAELKYTKTTPDGQRSDRVLVAAALTVFEKRGPDWVEVAMAETGSPVEGQAGM